MTSIDRPDLDEIEVTLFGPGYGESILIHIPGGEWIIVDSCIDGESKSPAALRYLNQIGVDVSRQVKLIVASHWHDDHMRGLSQTLRACSSSELCISGSLSCKEFVQLSSTISGQSRISGYSGIDELHESICEILNRGKRPILAGEGKLVWRNANCDIHALSPSDYTHLQVAREYQALLPKRLEPKKWLVPTNPNINHIAVVLLVNINGVSILLGSDLEESSLPHTGWSAIVASPTRPRNLASVFKIPHHGSENAHSNDVWLHMLEKNALSLCTPYNRKVTLPKSEDVERIYRFTDRAHISSTIRDKNLSSKRDSMVVKTIRESGIIIKSAPLKTGFIKCRWKNEIINIVHYNGANELKRHLL